MADHQSLTFPLLNRGWVQRIKPSMLQAGQFRKLQNLSSEQEGQVDVVAGSKNLGGTSVGNILHTLATLDLGATVARYAGGGQAIYRGAAWNSLSGTPIEATAGATWGDRWTWVDFDSARTGKPWIYIAATNGVFRDDGSKAALLPVGILPPLAPATVTPAGYDIVRLFDWEATGDVTASAGTKSAHHRFGATVSAVSGDGPYYTCTLSTVEGLHLGMLVKVGSQWVVVDQVTTSPATMSAYFASAPSGGQSVDDNGVHLAMAAAGTFTMTASSQESDASFGGREQDGYDTDDFIHLSVWASAPQNVRHIKLQLDVSDTPGDFIDYYEKTIVPSQVTSSVTATERAEDVAQERQRLRDELGLSPTDPEYWEYLAEFESGLDATQAGAQPVELSPIATNQWTELDIPKNQFLKVGAAGQPVNSWANIKQVRVSISALDACEVIVSSVYGVGGKYPKAVAVPYDYRYTYYDPETGHESNPSVPMVDPYRIAPWRQSVQVTVTGTDDAKVPTSSSQLSVKIYRRGGSLPDDWRYVGAVTNPGDGSTATFIDNAPDWQLADGAELLQFDNDAPVTSRLQIPLTAQISGIALEGGSGSATAGTINRLALTGLPTGFGDVDDAITVGSRVTVGTGATREISYVTAVGTNWIECYLQWLHQTTANDSGETVECGAAANKPCPLVAKVGASLFLAGDSNNPHYLYQSKTGEPDSWPVFSDEEEVSYQMPVGSPTNPINAITEYDDSVLCLCKKGIYLVRLVQNIMQQPLDIPYPHGLVARGPWCKSERSVWFLSDDGIYELAGYQPVKRTEGIDFLFTRKTVDGVAPLDYARANEVHLAYHQHMVHVLYPDTTGAWHELRYSTLYDRWYMRDHYDPDGGCSATAAFADPDDSYLYMAKTVTNGGTNAYVYQEKTGVTDGWTSDEDDGQGINYECIIPTFDLGDANQDKHFTEIAVEIENPGDSAENVTVKVYYDHSDTADGTDTFTVSAAAGRARYPLPLQTGDGKQAWAISIGLSGTSSVGMTFHSIAISFFPLGQIERGRARDWDYLGHLHDKRLYTVFFAFETEGQSVTVKMDTISGIEGNTEAQNAQSFVLQSAAGVRGFKTFKINDGTIVKAIKMRPTTAASAFRFFDYEIQQENLPPDIVPFTPWSDLGSPHEKYVQEMSIDVDTGGVAATCKVQSDGGDYQTITITTTASDRRRNITLKKAVKGRKFRLLNTEGSGGKFQLFDHHLPYLLADRGPVAHTHDWDLLEWPHDKELQRITFTYDNSGGTAQVTVDTLTGLDGSDETVPAFTFTLSGSGFSVQSFDFPADTIVKGIRVQPVSTTEDFKLWGYQVERTNHPPDVTNATEETDLGWPCPKILRGVTLKINTNNVAATVAIEADGVESYSTSVTTTYSNPTVILTPDSDITGTRFRITASEGVGGKTQIFDVDYDAIREPCPRTRWNSFVQSFGYAGYKFMKQVWFEYKCGGQVRISIYRDDDQLLHQETLPAAVKRDVVRFYVPEARDAGGGTWYLNKSILYRFLVESVDSNEPFQFYRDASRVETMPLSGDQHAAFQQHLLWPSMDIPV